MQSRSNGLGDGPARLDWLRCHFRMKTAVHSGVRHAGRVAALSLVLLFCQTVWPQAAAPKAATAPAPPEAPKDTLGRDTPRGAVLGFLNAARKGNAEVAALYLNTSLRGPDAATLARQLAVVLNRRLPPRLGQISDKPEGSVPDPLKPDEDLVGSISTANGLLDIMVERVDRGKAGKVWLFSRKTLSEIPVAFQELDTPPLEEILPQFMVKRVANIPIFEFLAIFVGLPLLYLLLGLLNRILGLAVGALRRRLRRNRDLKNPQILSPPVRLLLLALTIRWVITRVSLPLLARQFWSTVVLMIAVAACMWLLMLLNGRVERYIVGRGPTLSGSAAVLRLFRRLIDGLILFGGLIFTLYHFDVNLTAALAGLGVGGIAVALAAQKTLENLIAGVSLIADQAVHVGDFMNLGDVQGTVEEVGLRSTRIRTPDRTVVTLPNAQIANIKLETVSARDKFWFHPVLSLRYETTAAQLSSVVSGVHGLLSEHRRLDTESVRVRFFRLGPSSLDVDIFAYVFARDWNDFLEIQEQLLLGIMDIVQKAGTGIALPSQTLYLAADSSSNERTQPIQMVRTARN